MKQTVVPNRNMVMIAIAGSIAVAQGADYVATGVHSGDHFIYPDCRPGFINSMTEALYKGNEGFGNLRGVFAPFMTSTKADIAMWALKLGTPIEKTWSCYNGGEIHCGKCGTCVERLEAIHQAIQALTGAEDYLKQTSDLTKYEDSEYWKTVTA